MSAGARSVGRSPVGPRQMCDPTTFQSLELDLANSSVRLLDQQLAASFQLLAYEQLEADCLTKCSSEGLVMPLCPCSQVYGLIFGQVHGHLHDVRDFCN